MSTQGQDLFRNMYRQRLQQVAERARDERDTSCDTLRDAEFPRPEGLSEGVWARLGQGQRAARLIDGWRKLATGRAEELGLTEADFLRCSCSELEVSQQAAEAVVAIVQCGLSNAKNPTIMNLIERVNQAVTRGEPLQFVVSQCIAKSPVVRPAKLDFFTGRDARPRDIPCFTAGLERKGWSQLRELLGRLNYPSSVTMMLGDMDLLTIDGARLWATPGSLRRLRAELTGFRESIRDSARTLFGPEGVRVQGWSDRYSVTDFDAALARAEDLSRWQDRSLIPASADLYRQYGYRELQRTLGLPAQAMDTFILNDVVRTAAQYRMEADIVQQDGAIQLWAESVPDRIWPIRISNYDGAGYVPAVALV